MCFGHRATVIPSGSVSTEAAESASRRERFLLSTPPFRRPPCSKTSTSTSRLVDRFVNKVKKKLKIKATINSWIQFAYAQFCRLSSNKYTAGPFSGSIPLSIHHTFSALHDARRADRRRHKPNPRHAEYTQSARHGQKTPEGRGGLGELQVGGDPVETASWSSPATGEVHDPNGPHTSRRLIIFSSSFLDATVVVQLLL